MWNERDAQDLRRIAVALEAIQGSLEKIEKSLAPKTPPYQWPLQYDN